MGARMGEDSRRYGDDSSLDRDAQFAAASRPAPGKQTLAQTSASADSGQAAERGHVGGAQRAEAWVADDALMAAMGLSDAPWCGEDESEHASEKTCDGGGEGGQGGGGEVSEGEDETSSHVAQDSPNSSTSTAPVSPSGDQFTDYERALSSIALPATTSTSSAPSPPSPGSTVDISALSDEAQQKPTGLGSSASKQRTVLGPPDQARSVHGSPDEGSASSSKEDFLQPGWRLINQPGIVYDEAGALLRKSPTSTATSTPLAQNAKVHILKHNAAARWYAVVTSEGNLGYVADWLLWRHLPEHDANVYRIKKGDTPLGIAREHYGPHFTRWGQDLRFVVNALVYVNQNNNHNGIGRAGLAKKGTVAESWLRAAAVEDVYVWLPSVDYLNSIYEEIRKQGGGTGSHSFDTFSAAANKAGAFSVFPSYVGGLFHGFLGSLGDTVSGLTELVKSIFTGEIIEDLKKLFSVLSKLSVKDIVEALGSWAQSWGPRLTSDNHFVRGHAWGYFAGYLCAEIAMFAIGGAALSSLRASRLATKLGQTLARTLPRITAAVSRVTTTVGASSKVLREAKDSILKRFGAALAEEVSKLRFRELIEVAVASGVEPVSANRLARILHTAGIGARKVASWGDKAFTNLASNPRTLIELEATISLARSGRIVGIEDWLKFGAGKTGDDAANVAAELREARRLAREHPKHKINVGGDARAPRSNGDPQASFDLSIDDAAGKTTRSLEMTSVDDPVENASHLSSAISHAADKVSRRKAAGKPIPGKIESIVEIDLAQTVRKGSSGELHISRSGDIVQVTPTIPPKLLPKGNIFAEFAKNASKIKNHQLVDVVTVVDRKTGAVLGRIERDGAAWKRSE